MKKLFLAAAAMFLFSTYSIAQTGNNQVSVGAEVNFLASNGYSDFYHPGFGGNLKGLYGIGAAGQITLSGGFTTFSSKSGSAAAGQTLNLVPIQAGYRYNFKQGFYIEPQVGVGILTTKASDFSFSQTNFAASLNAGYTTHGFDFSVRYYTEGDVVSLFALRVAYNFSIGGK